MKTRDITRERVLELLDYDPLTGILTWKVDRANKKAGDRAGHLNAALGYETVCIDYRNYYSHRLVFLIEHGWLPQHVDHANRDKANNRKVELRAANASLNVANSKLSKANTSGHKGVSWNKQRSKWAATIMVNYRTIHLGYYANIGDAAAAYAAAAKRYFGEFARLT
jgi:AP2 domain/HNH endonuclease